jgi:hypothetical protein
MISPGFVRLKVPIAIVVIFVLATSLLLFERPIAATVQEGTNEQRQRKYDDYLSRHSAKRRGVELMAPYWRIGGGFESTLVLNNTFPRDIEVTPVVYAENGQRIPASNLTLAKMATISVRLRDLIGVEGQGQITLQFQGEPLEVHGSVVITNEALSISFNHPFEKRSNFSTSQLDGIFYAPSASTGVDLALSNIGNQNLEVALLVRGEVPGGSEGRTAGPNQPIALSPHETRVVNLRPFLANNF